MAKLIEINKDYTKFQKISLEYAEKYKLLMNKTTVAQSIVDIYKKKINHETFAINNDSRTQRAYLFDVKKHLSNF